MSDCPLWPDEFDTAALKRAGYSYREVREMFPVWEASIPLHERKAAEAHMSAFFDGVDAALVGLGRALGVLDESGNRVVAVDDDDET